MKKEIKKIEVCSGAICSSYNSEKVFDELKKEFQNVRICGCMGKCGRGSNVLIGEKRILHYSKPHNISDRIKSDEGEKYNRPNENEIFEVLNDI
jgi:NADH:ubiquinone oxidoreductase subunit E